MFFYGHRRNLCARNQSTHLHRSDSYKMVSWTEYVTFVSAWGTLLVWPVRRFGASDCWTLTIRLSTSVKLKSYEESYWSCHHHRSSTRFCYSPIMLWLQASSAESAMSHSPLFYPRNYANHSYFLLWSHSRSYEHLSEFTSLMNGRIPNS